MRSQNQIRSRIAEITREIAAIEKEGDGIHKQVSAKREMLNQLIVDEGIKTEPDSEQTKLRTFINTSENDLRDFQGRIIALDISRKSLTWCLS